jgi:DNA-binding CsgD family transcriptional regulator
MVHPDRATEIILMNGLTPREIAVANLVAQGLTNKQIGRALKIGHEGVKMHLRNIFQKLYINNRTVLAIMVLGGGHA